MSKIGNLMKQEKWRIIFLLLIQMVVPASPAYALNYEDFSNSMNSAFNSDFTRMENIVSLMTGIFFIAVVVLIVRFSFRHEEKQRAEKMRPFSFKRLDTNAKRKFYRTSIELDVMWSPLGKQTGKSLFYNDKVMNLSGGGLCFRTAESLDYGEQITICLDIGGAEPLSLQSKVSRVKPLASAGTAMYEVAVQFLSIPRNQRDQIVRFVMKLERDYIKLKKSEKKQEPNIEQGSEEQIYTDL